MSIFDQPVGSKNYTADRNRFNLPAPPAWVLQAFWDFDAGLLLVPSRQGRKYLLLRRREFSKQMTEIARNARAAADIMDPVKRVTNSDSELMATLNAVLVDTISGNVYSGSWTRSMPAILQQLRDRDIWRAGGADKLVDTLEATEQTVVDKDRATLLDSIEHRARDAWRSYQARTGQRNQRARSGRAKIVPVGTL